LLFGFNASIKFPLIRPHIMCNVGDMPIFQWGRVIWKLKM
jgi:hypothetical protein